MTDEWVASIENWRQSVTDDLLSVARQSVYELALRVVMDTPVDIGFLRGGWQPSIGELPPPKDAEKDAAGAAALADLAVSLAGLTLGETIYYTNAVIYARRIEYGFVGFDSLGRYYNQQGRFYVMNNVAQWQSIVSAKAVELMP